LFRLEFICGREHIHGTGPMVRTGGGITHPQTVTKYGRYPARPTIRSERDDRDQVQHSAPRGRTEHSLFGEMRRLRYRSGGGSAARGNDQAGRKCALTIVLFTDVATGIVALKVAIWMIPPFNY
jgi:hypothetical protein